MTAPLVGTWSGFRNLSAQGFVCGHCGNQIGSNLGWVCEVQGRPNGSARVFLCPFCNRPSYFEDAAQIPGVASGGHVGNVPAEVEKLYDEARNCTAANSHTAAVLATRKLLMHIAVNKGADAGKSFVEYVEFLSDKGYVPPDGKTWVDHIRKKGNEANHEIALMGKTDAEELLVFAEMLLKFIYEFPSRIPKTGP